MTLVVPIGMSGHVGVSFIYHFWTSLLKIKQFSHFKLAVVCFLLCQVQVLMKRLINSKYCWSIMLTMTLRKIAEHAFFSGVALVFMSFKTFLMFASLWSKAALLLHQGSTVYLSLSCYNSTEVIHLPQLKQSYNQWPQCSLVIRAALP